MRYTLKNGTLLELKEYDSAQLDRDLCAVGVIALKIRDGPNFHIECETLTDTQKKAVEDILNKIDLSKTKTNDKNEY